MKMKKIITVLAISLSLVGIAQPNEWKQELKNVLEYSYTNFTKNKESKMYEVNSKYMKDDKEINNFNTHIQYTPDASVYYKIAMKWGEEKECFATHCEKKNVTPIIGSIVSQMKKHLSTVFFSELNYKDLLSAIELGNISKDGNKYTLTTENEKYKREHTFVVDENKQFLLSYKVNSVNLGNEEVFSIKNTYAKSEEQFQMVDQKYLLVEMKKEEAFLLDGIPLVLKHNQKQSDRTADTFRSIDKEEDITQDVTFFIKQLF